MLSRTPERVPDCIPGRLAEPRRPRDWTASESTPRGVAEWPHIIRFDVIASHFNNPLRSKDWGSTRCEVALQIQSRVSYSNSLGHDALITNPCDIRFEA